MTTPGLATVLRLRRDIRHTRVGDEGVVLRQDDAEVLVINDVAARVIELLDGNRSLADIVETLRQEYDIDADTLAADVAAYGRELTEAGVAESD
jgi:Coenzyme PQQ synthesis protein D (PqqD)